MKMMKRSVAAIALAAAQLAVASGGDTWRYTGEGYKEAGFTNAVYWTDHDGAGSKGVNGATLDPDDYYLVENWKVLYTIISQAAKAMRPQTISCRIIIIRLARAKLILLR